MPRISEETTGGGNVTWISDTSTMRAGRTVEISIDSNKTAHPDGFIPSGTPLTLAGNVATPWTAGTIDAFLLWDFSLTGSGNALAAVYDHGRVIVENLPVTVPVETVAAPRLHLI